VQRHCLAVIALLSVMLGLFAFYRMANTAHKAFFQNEDLFAALVAFVERRGRFPSSEAEFRASAWIQYIDEDCIRVLPVQSAILNLNVNGVSICLSDYRILWGADLAGFRVDASGKVYDREDNVVLLVFRYGYASWSKAVTTALSDVTGRAAP